MISIEIEQYRFKLTLGVIKSVCFKYKDVYIFLDESNIVVHYYPEFESNGLYSNFSLDVYYDTEVFRSYIRCHLTKEILDIFIESNQTFNKFYKHAKSFCGLKTI
jgi:hypothetical protein